MLYDFACTAFVVVVVTFVWGLYFKGVVVGGRAGGDLLWGAAGAASTLLVAVAAPLLGAAADEAGLKPRLLTIFSLAAIASSACLGLVGPGMIATGFILFVVANSSFQIAGVFYHAFLPELAPAGRLSRVSGYGWALGYLGAICTLVAISPLISGGFGRENLHLVRLAFPAQAVIFLVFALPAFILLRGERPRTQESLGELSRLGLSRLRATWRGLAGHSQLVRFLGAYLLFNDGINTVLYFAMIYAAYTLGLSMRQLIALYIVVQTTGIVGAAALGAAGDRLGMKPTLSVCLASWLVVLAGAWMARTPAFFFGVAAAAGLLIGSTQALARAMMALLTPEGRSAEFFSFYGISGKISAAAGPLTFGLVSYLTGSQRAAILSIAVFFVGGLLLLVRVDIPLGLRERASQAARIDTC
jgi:UMF1 family MFS transporter